MANFAARYPHVDLNTARRLAHAHDARTLAALADEADRTAAALYEQADDEEGANRRNTLASAGSHASQAAALRAAADMRAA